MKRMAYRYQQGFTLLELLVVIVVIAILAAVSIIAYNGIQNRANDTVKAANIDNILKLAVAHKAQTGDYPPVIQEYQDETDSFCSSLQVGFIDNVDTSILHNPSAPDEYLNAFNGCVIEVQRIIAPNDGITFPDGSTVRVEGEFYADLDEFFDTVNDALLGYVSTYPPSWTPPPIEAEVAQYYDGFQAAYPQYACLDMTSGPGNDALENCEVTYDDSGESAPEIKSIPIKDEWRYQTFLMYDKDDPAIDVDVTYRGVHYPYSYCGRPPRSAATGMQIRYWSDVKDEWVSRSVGSGVVAPDRNCPQ